MGLADLHIHSTYSHDATTTIRAILKQSKDIGLDVIAVTDHDEIRGSLEARELAPQYGIEAIPGVEVSTRDGHLIALFVEKQPTPGLPLAETLIQIGKMGGIAIVPHPFNNLPGSLSMDAVIGALANSSAKGTLKGIETHNMGTQAFDTVAQKLSVYLPLAKIASSDAHVYWAIGAAHTEFPGRTAYDLRTAIDRNVTLPIPYEEEFSVRAILSWMRYMLLRSFGYASDSRSANQPIDTQRFTQTFIRKIKKK